MNKNLRAHPMRNPLILALDVDTRDQALKIADQIGDIVGGIKLGPRLCLRYGMEFVQEMSQRAPIFLDNKHFDIPSTMEAAVRASFDAGASLVTVHALSGAEALQRMAKAEAELSKIRPFRILAVTILTSWDQSSLPPVMNPQPIAQHVTELASLVQKSGLSGVVCSPHELDLLQNQGLYLVTPGIRFSINDSGDQKRIMGPQEALEKGASALVVGRPILEAKDIKEAANQFVMAM
ncbi:orotidine-5'-phosphate decarboxylase [Bdellovibrio sp. ZAP7]|uniref:orotidine-5'-phosphate decarboxylase n=1 Tax=Bdellovibrio sp. ZAP7 TaxID=2231053 RepID=UPI001158D716|nr:orotidine-5'-phosphate decarboxylase [Bdellovibrio sp. ZAP7]QDK44354.1 orotidine-5'-phosphate decarboxylase [Bdellovibrio sp. ZAP7]